MNQKSDDTIGALLWLPVLGFLALSAAFFFAVGYHYSNWEPATRPALLLLGSAIGALMMRYEKFHLPGTLATLNFQMTAVAVAGLMLAYACATSGRPLADAVFVEADRLLGYDWVDYTTYFLINDWWFQLLIPAYESIYLQPIGLIFLLGYYGQRARAEKVVLAAIIALVITNIIFALYPVTTAWVHAGLRHAQIDRYTYLPDTDMDWLQALVEIRKGDRLVESYEAFGLIGFPSFHAASALIFTWASWSLRSTRIAFVIINALMIMGAPILGGHYVSDLVGGALVAWLAVVFARRTHAALLNLRSTLNSPSHATFETA
jgi:membrane-associated phospholipid phosphatase